MREINVLYGFKNKKTEESITKELQSLGYEVNKAMRYRKRMIKDYIDEHPELDAVILKEYLDGGERYGTQELVSLTDDANVNVVVVLRSSHRGHDMMRELYNAGILNAYFANGKSGANPEKLVDLVLHSRTRRQAREYYKIDEKPLRPEILAHEEFRDCFSYLTDEEEGMNIMDRFTQISRWLTPQQMGVFISTLPEDVTEILKQYQEYYKIHAQLYRKRYVREPLKMPKDAEAALSPQALANALVEEAEKEPVDDSPKIEAVEIKMVNHMPIPPEETEEDMKHIRQQEITPGRKYEGKKAKAVDDDIHAVADRKQEKEVKPLFDFIEKFGKSSQRNSLNIAGRLRRRKKNKEEAIEEVTEVISETAAGDEAAGVDYDAVEMEEVVTIGNKSADELMEMFGE